VYNLLKGLDVNTLRIALRGGAINRALTSIGALAGDNVAGQNLRAYLDTLRHVKPLLGGSYLQELGVEPGPIYSRILRELQEAKLEGQLPERADEEKFVRDLLEREGRTGEK
jgi:tRNA nucleotidyltransferase (CCA-adding enzyme)